MTVAREALRRLARGSRLGRSWLHIPGATARNGVHRLCALLMRLVRLCRSIYHGAFGREDPAWVGELRSRLVAFYDDFECLVDLICASWRSGVVGGMEAEYHRLALAMKDTYSTLKPYALAFLDVDVSDAEFGLEVCGRATDALECLFLPEDLASIHSMDQEVVAGRVRRAREALHRLGDYLREVGR